MLLHHIAIAARDPSRLADFYERVLGLQRLGNSDANIAAGSVWLTLSSADAGSLLMLEQADDHPGGAARLDPGIQGSPGALSFETKTAGFHLVALRIAPDERRRWLTKLRAAGVRIENESEFTVYFLDPEGNRIGLSHYPEPEPTANRNDPGS